MVLAVPLIVLGIIEFPPFSWKSLTKNGMATTPQIDSPRSAQAKPSCFFFFCIGSLAVGYLLIRKKSATFKSLPPPADPNP